MTPEIKAGIIIRFVQIFFILCFQAAILFGTSGDLDWIQAWLFIDLNLLGIFIMAPIMLRYSPETIAARSMVIGEKSWDTIVTHLWFFVHSIAMLFIAGLDRRYEWTERIGLSFKNSSYFLGR